MRTTKQDPTLCTNAPVVGVKTSSNERIIAIQLMTIDKAILNFIVLIVASDNHLI